jgi:quinol-cytochrome oxidoreductase complex cytochrome b subunit
MSAAKPLSIADYESPDDDALEPESKRLPIGPDHVLYPFSVGVALFGILIGGGGRHLADDMPDEKTHPFFPDQFWPYPVLTVVLLATLGLLAAFFQKNLELDGSADPRALLVPRPDWYFLFLFQFLKLGPDVLMSLVVPGAVLAVLVLWPFIDSAAGPAVARRLGWKTWPVPGRNVITGTIALAGLGVIGILTIWALVGSQLCVPWFVNGPVCGG